MVVITKPKTGPDTNLPNQVDQALRNSIANILKVTLEPISFQKQLEEILDIIVSMTWLGAQKKGAIFVSNHNQELVMAVQHNLDNNVKTRCAKVGPGYCLCGKVFSSKKLIFKSNVDGDHDFNYQGMQDHGHFAVPIFGKEQEVIGVLILYLDPEHQTNAEEEGFLQILANILSNIILNRDLQLKAEISNIRMQKAQLEITEKLVVASEFRDAETGDHIKRMSMYSVAIGQELDLDKVTLERLLHAAPMHDIGKVGIADSILLKKGKLSDEEMALMKTHTSIGADILTGDHDLIKAGREIAESHHECWDGSGYPNKLAGQDIPLLGRICALADVFDALTTVRPYKEAWPLEKALTLIKDQTGKQFDPQVVEAFFNALPKILEIQSRYLNASENIAESLPLKPNENTEDYMMWQDSLSVGVPGMDNQHKYLINLINRLHSAISDFNVREIVEGLLDMKSYSVTHFRDEERMMEEAGYPGLEIHKKIHQSFIEKTEELTNDFERSPMATTLDMVMYLKEWTVNHIMAVDSDYQEYFATLKESVQDENIERIR